MDIEKYIAGKANGISKVTRQGASTLLIKWPDGFNESDGSPKAAKEQGFQAADIAAMRAADAAALVAAQAAVVKAQARLGMHDVLLADIAKVP